MIRRRPLLAAGAGLFAWAHQPRLLSAAGGRDPRLVTIILRGALDGLSAVAPLGDPDYAGLREGIALARDGERPALMLDGFFGLHPALPNFARLYAAGEALVVHAVASPYRERSHFDGQDVLESGQQGPGLTASGWLNRVLTALPAGQPVQPGLGVGAMTPLILRGPAPVLGWASPVAGPAEDDLAERVMALYRHSDPVLAQALHNGVATDRMARRNPAPGADGRRGGSDTADGMRRAAIGAARLLAQPDGPRLAALAFDGWDTHANEGGATGRLAQLLAGLDGALAALHTGLAAVWRDTVIVVATEFGRTARVNGTTGTDHGTATVALLAGGAVRGGRVVADWPGLQTGQLFEARDLRATTDIRAVFKGVLADLLGVSPAVLGTAIFPGSARVVPMSGLIV